MWSWSNKIRKDKIRNDRVQQYNEIENCPTSALSTIKHNKTQHNNTQQMLKWVFFKVQKRYEQKRLDLINK